MSEVVSVDLELQGSIRLDVIAVELNKAHHEAEMHARDAINRARAAGDYLTEAKALCKHGEWLPWLKDHFKGSERTARNYMRLASHWNELGLKTAAVADLSVRSALELLSDKADELLEDEQPEPDEGEPEIVPPPSGLIKSFGDAQLTRSWEAHELSTDVAVLVGQVKTVCGPFTYDVLWIHAHEDAKVRRSEPQLRHLLHIGLTNDDAETAEIVERVESGLAKDVFDAHKQRQREREEAAKPKLSDADHAIADRAAQDLVGFDKQVDPNGLADMQRITLELSQTDGWDDLEADEKQRFIQTQAGEEHAASIKSSRPKPKAGKEIDPDEMVSIPKGQLASYKKLARYAPLQQRLEHTKTWKDAL